MKKIAVWIMMVLLLFGLIGCGSKQDEIIERYKSEARYYYEQVNGIITELNVIEDIDNSIENMEDNYFSITLSNAMFRGACLENLISVNQYYSGLDTGIKQMESLYNSISHNKEISEIQEIVDEIDVKCNDLKKLLEESKEYDSDFENEYNCYMDDITKQMNILYGFVVNEESAVHNIEANNEYQEQLDEIEQVKLNEKEQEELLPNRDVNNPVLEGESVNIKFLDFSERNVKGDCPCTVDCNIKFKSYDEDTKTACLNFEILSSETSSAVYVGDGISGGSSLVYIFVDENLAATFAGYDAVYGEETWDTYISAYEGGNVDCNVNVQDYSYLQISYSPATEENKKLSRENKYCTEEIIWFKLK